MWCTKLILISCISLVVCRPQNQQIVETAEAEPQVEIDRQIIHEVIPLSNTDGPPSVHQASQRNIDANTKEILQKIAEVNKKQGLMLKKQKPNYFHFPFSYSRSQDDEKGSNDFKFPRDPFSNPILDYLEKAGSDNKESMEIPTFRRPNFDSPDPNSLGSSMTDTNAEIVPEDNIPGQYIKRKITHYQSFLMPNLPMFNIGPSPPFPPLSDPGMYSPADPQLSSIPPANYNYRFSNPQFNNPMGPYQPGPNIPNAPQNFEQNKNQTSPQKQTIDNVRDMILESQLFGGSMLPSYYNQRPQTQGYNSDLRNMYLSQQNQQFSEQLPVLSPNSFPGINNPNKQDTIMHNLLKNRIFPQQIRARQNWNWPGANLFPIYIRDPFLQMYYAVTNMIEYGPSAGNEGPCKLTPRPQGTRVKVNSKATPDINTKSQQVTFEMNRKEGSDELKVADIDGRESADDIGYLDVEEIDVGDDDLVKFTINFPKSSSLGAREFKEERKAEKIKWNDYIKLRNDTLLTHLATGKLDFSSETLPGMKPSPPVIKDQILHVEELEDEPAESEKAEDISVSNQGAKKVFSKDNTGDGIFIHKLKVRKGGVAIAGPGGIATAGSGGTAIVGPNGIAYTHPDGLAIAGSGTKVVAVDPSIDLNEVIKNTVLNGTRHVPNTRMGKVVAVGPVIYYNRGV